jgi:hypothetical protein
MTMHQSSATENSAATAGTETLLGRPFVDALARKDFDQLTKILHPEIDFRGLTPGRAWEASGSRALVEDVLQTWFEESDELERLVASESDSFADRARVSYRLEGRNPDGPFVVEQQAYYTERDGRIDWMRVLCSGFRPRQV